MLMFKLAVDYRKNRYGIESKCHGCCCWERESSYSDEQVSRHNIFDNYHGCSNQALYRYCRSLRADLDLNNQVSRSCLQTIFKLELPKDQKVYLRCLEHQQAHQILLCIRGTGAMEQGQLIWALLLPFHQAMTPQISDAIWNADGQELML